MTTRLQARLSQARDGGRGILIGFLPAGFPDPQTFTERAGEAFDAGLDALEISMPGPAPALDGPLIHAAAEQAGQYLSGVPAALALGSAARTSNDQIIVALAYDHTLDMLGPELLLSELRAADIDALLLPQQSVANQIAVGITAQSLGIEPMIFLHRQEDLALLASCALERPIIYLQSADLQTGGTFNSVKAIERLGELAESFGEKEYWVVVGFGVRGADEVALLMNAGAHGAVIGTALVTAASQGAGAVSRLLSDIPPALVMPTVSVA